MTNVSSVAWQLGSDFCGAGGPPASNSSGNSVDQVLEVRGLVAAHVVQHVVRQARAAELGVPDLLGHELAGRDLVAPREVRGLVDPTEERHHEHEVAADDDRQQHERARRVAKQRDHPCHQVSVPLVRVEDEHAAGRVVRNRVGDAAEEASPALHALVADHDEVGAEVGGDVAQHLGRAPEPGMGLDRSRHRAWRRGPTARACVPAPARASSSHCTPAADPLATAISDEAIAVAAIGFWTLTMCSVASPCEAARSAASTTARIAPSLPSVPTTIVLNIGRDATSGPGWCAEAGGADEAEPDVRSARWRSIPLPAETA